jgi:hypothetical protein
VQDSMGECGSPGPGSKGIGRPVQFDSSRQSENPSPDPTKREKEGEEYG